MPIISDRRAVIDLAQNIASESPAMTSVDAAAHALRQFYSLTSSDGIWGGSQAAICMGYFDKSSDEDLFERIARDVGRMVMPESKNGLLDTDEEGTIRFGLPSERPRGPRP